jgi:broad specificity phosphatase PhoE
MAQPNKTRNSKKPDGWILFVRHSESCANQLKAAYKDKKGLQKLGLGLEKMGYKDPELTELGEAWATLRGTQLAPYVSQTTKMFASTLFRTQLTALFILEGIQKTKPEYWPIITVLPNSSEVSGFSYFEKDNAPLNPADFVSFSERLTMYKEHLLKPTSIYTTHPSYELFIQTLDRYNKSSNHRIQSRLGNEAVQVNPLYSRIMKNKITQFADKASLFRQPPESKRKAAVASNPDKLKQYLEENAFFITPSRNASTSVKIGGLSAIPIKDGPKYHPTEVTVDHLDAIIVSHGGVMKAIIQSLGGKKPQVANLDSILFRINNGKISAAYLMPMPNRESALKLGFPETDKSCLRNECQGQKGGSLQKRTRRRQKHYRTRTRYHRRRGQGQP